MLLFFAANISSTFHLMHTSIGQNKATLFVKYNMFPSQFCVFLLYVILMNFCCHGNFIIMIICPNESDSLCWMILRVIKKICPSSLNLIERDRFAIDEIKQNFHIYFLMQFNCCLLIHTQFLDIICVKNSVNKGYDRIANK